MAPQSQRRPALQPWLGKGGMRSLCGRAGSHGASGGGGCGDGGVGSTSRQAAGYVEHRRLSFAQWPQQTYDSKNVDIARLL